MEQNSNNIKKGLKSTLKEWTEDFDFYFLRQEINSALSCF